MPEKDPQHNFMRPSQFITSRHLSSMNMQKLPWPCFQMKIRFSFMDS